MHLVGQLLILGLTASFSNLQAIYLTVPKVICRSFLQACRLTYLITKNYVLGTRDVAVINRSLSPRHGASSGYG